MSKPNGILAMNPEKYREIDGVVFDPDSYARHCKPPEQEKKCEDTPKADENPAETTAHAASRLHAPEGRRRVLTSTIQTRSTVNPGTPHRRAALLTDTSVPVVRRKEVADSRLSPGVSAGRSETALGITAVTRSAGDTLPQGFPPHRLSPVVRLYRGVSGSRSRMRQAVVTSVITHLASLDYYTPE